MPAVFERPDLIQTRHLSGVITRVRAEGEQPEGDESIRYEFTASTDGVVQLWGSTFEILDHGQKSVRMDWFKSGNAPALWMHDRTQIRGIIESATLSGNKVSVIVRMSPNEDTKELIKDIDAGIIRNVSIGYRVFAEVMESREVDADGYPTKTTWRVTDWEPKEVSFVTIPADVDTGFGRAADELKTRVSYLEGLAAADISTRTNTMSEPANPTITVVEHEKQRTDAVTAERERTARINDAVEKAREANLGDFSKRAAEAIKSGESSEDFHRHIMANLSRTAPVTTESLGLTGAEQKRFSLLNIMDGISQGKPEMYRFEQEVSDAAREAYGHQTKGGNLCIPQDVLIRGWFPKDPSVSARMGLGERERTLISVSASGANASNLVEKSLLSELFIYALRENTVLLSDCTIIPGLVGDADIPIELLSPNFFWVGEDIEPTEGVWTASTVPFRFKTIGARIPITRRSLKQTTPNIEGILAANLRRGAAIAIEKQMFYGAGSSTVPTGILSTSGIGDVTSAGTLTFANIVELWSDVSDANAHTAGSKFYASSRGAGRMRGTGIVANDAQRIATWDNGVMYCEGKEVKITNCIPNNIATNKTAILYGDPSSVYVGMWGGLELATDLATKAATGGKVIRVFQDVDFQIPQPAHWSAIQDLTP